MSGTSRQKHTMCRKDKEHLFTLNLVAWRRQAVEPPSDVAHAGMQPAAPREEDERVAQPPVVLKRSRLYHTLNQATILLHSHRSSNRQFAAVFGLSEDRPMGCFGHR